MQAPYKIYKGSTVSVSWDVGTGKNHEYFLCNIKNVNRRKQPSKGKSAYSNATLKTW